MFITFTMHFPCFGALLAAVQQQDVLQHSFFKTGMLKVHISLILVHFTTSFEQVYHDKVSTLSESEHCLFSGYTAQAKRKNETIRSYFRSLWASIIIDYIQKVKCLSHFHCIYPEVYLAIVESSLLLCRWNILLNICIPIITEYLIRLFSTENNWNFMNVCIYNVPIHKMVWYLKIKCWSREHGTNVNGLPLANGKISNRSHKTRSEYINFT